jgi:hypothetical protein
MDADMSQKTQQHDPCAEGDARHGCERPPLERLRFWNGRFLVARDMEHQQDDLIRRLEYHQAHAHGEGILCGFDVRPHPRPECRDRFVVVTSGMAYDCCGHTLWLPCASVVELPPHREQDREPEQEPDREPEHKGRGREARQWADVQAMRADEPEERPEQWAEQRPDLPEQRPERPEPRPRPTGRECVWEGFVVARRVECLTHPMPALYSEDLCEPVRHEYGRIRDEVEVSVVPGDSISDTCWSRGRRAAADDCTRTYEDDCDDATADPCGPHCDCGEFVVLARLCRDTEGRLHIDTHGRRLLGPERNLTRITGVSWPHGGRLSLEELRQMNGELVVHFSRRIEPSDTPARGINRMTFQLAYLGQGGVWHEVLPPDVEDPGGSPPVPRLSENGRCAIYRIPGRYLGGDFSLGGFTMRVRLLCDFVLDCHGRAVSGAHLGGYVNERGTGGPQGGVFESWFRLGFRPGDES